MTPRVRGVVLALVQVGLIASLGGKLLVDRARYPRVWARAEPYDPDLPIRGRYVSLRLVKDPAAGVPAARVAFFIPEHVADPSRRDAGESLWAEVTLPPDGPPRPIRLGVRRGDGPIVPLDLD